MKKLIGLGIAVVVLAAVMMIPVGGGTMTPSGSSPKVASIDLSAFPKEPPKKGLRLLFIHHSCGGQLFADPGQRVGENCVYATHPNGGGLRSLLASQGYEAHEASYKSEIGDKTDIFHWPPKFSAMMDKVLTCDQQNTYYTDGRRNQIVAFKSCFPNNQFVGPGTPPGNPAGPDLTVWNAKAAYAALLPEFAKQPGVLFVCVTAPPLVGTLRPEPLWKALARVVLNRPRDVPSRSGPLAREFNNWLKAPDGWLKGYAGRNVVVFDYYDILTAEGKSDYAEYPTGSTGDDSHPNREGNTKAAQAFVPFLNQAAHRAGL